jgi:ribulose-5-phosphate 4-epimerase/fuculose-1-phosphate aldolase
MSKDWVSGKLKERLINSMRVASTPELMPARQGNLSVRDPDTGYLAITPHAYAYAVMTVEDLVVLDPTGSKVAGQHEPSADSRVHATVYRERSDVNAVIHSEPPYVNAFGALGREINTITTNGLKSSRGDVPIMPFWGGPRDENFALEMLKIMGDRDAVIWRNHGLVVVSDSIELAVDKTIGVEFNAQVLFIALQVGQPQALRYGEDSKMMTSDLGE